MGLAHSPSVIIDGLVFYLDPNNTRSYAGYGNTVYNLVNSSIGGTFVGYTSNPIDNTENRSIYFDGSTNYLNGPNNIALTNNFTVSIWFKLRIYNDSAVVNKWYADNSNSHRCWFIGTETSSSSIVVVLSSNGTYLNSTIKRYVVPVSLNKYTNITFTFLNGTLLVYKDGILYPVTKSLDGSFTSVFDTVARTIQFGYGYDYGNYYGSSNVGITKIYNRVLTADEILQNYNAAKKKYDPDENIVTNALIFNIDANKNLSYPGTGNTIYDISGSGQTGTFTNGPTFSALNGGSIVFDGTNDYIDYPRSSLYDFGSSDFTIMYWINTTAKDRYNAVIDLNDAGGKMIIGTYNNLSWMWFTSSYNIVGTINLCDGIWHQATISRIGSTLTHYVDGRVSVSTNVGATVVPSNNFFSIGRLVQTSSYGEIKLADVKIYKNRGLTQQEILQNYNAAKNRFVNALPPVRNGLVLELDAGQRASYPGTGNTWYDLSGNGYNYTLTNGPSFLGIGATSSILFDGSNDRALAINPISLGTAHTVSMIVKPSAVSEDGVLFGDYGYNNTGYALYFLNGTSLYYTVSDFVNTSITLSTNWIMFTVTRNETSVSFYQNGILLGSYTLGGNNALTLRSIADFNGGGYPFQGNISQVSCYNRALSAYEVKQNFDFYRTRYNI
jgi:hypothetical protein